jgi:hypothetical protein
VNYVIATDKDYVRTIQYCCRVYMHMQATAAAATVTQDNEKEKVRVVAAARKRSFFFALCESCFWSATVLQEGSLPDGCPLCSGGSQGVSMIPLGTDEEYRLKAAPSGGGLEMSFGRRVHRR